LYTVKDVGNLYEVIREASHDKFLIIASLIADEPPGISPFASRDTPVQYHSILETAIVNDK